MATVVQDLVTKFSFTGSDAPLKNYNQSLSGSIKLLGGFVLGLEAAAGAFAFWADGVLGGVESLDQLSKVTRIAVSDIQELNFVAGQTQSTSAAMESTLRSLGSTIGSAAQKGSEDFARLGINVRDANGEVKNADMILDEVRQRFQALGLSIQEQEHFASALGIDSSLLQLMGKTNSEMASLRDRARELGTLTAEQTEQADLYKKSLNSMWFSLNSVKQLVAVGVAPEMSNLADSFSDLLAANKEWIVDGIQTTIKWSGNLLDALSRLLPVFTLAAGGFLVMKIAALGFGTVMGIIFSPLVLWTAGIAAGLVILDDLIVAMNGGKSVIADFFQEFFGVDVVPVLTGIVDAAVYVAGQLKDIWVSVGDFMQDIFGGIGKLFSGDFIAGIDDIWNAFKNLATSLYDIVFAPLFDSIGKLIAGMLPDWALKIIGLPVAPRPAYVEKYLPAPTFVPEPEGYFLPAGSDFVPEPATGAFTPESIPFGAGTGGSTTNTSNQVSQDVDIHISTNDPEAAGRSVQDGLQRQLDNANTQFDIGGR